MHQDQAKNGCAFVKFSEREMAQKAIDSLDGEIQLDGVDKPIRVKFANPEKQHEWRQRHNGPYGGMHQSHDMYNQRGNMGGGYYMGHGAMSPVYPQAATPEEYSQAGSVADGSPRLNLSTTSS